MFITKMSLPRRTFLHGMGATLALPLLEAMVPAFSARPAAPVRRFGAHLRAARLHHGAVARRPPAARSFEFPPILKPLEPFRESLSS